MNQVISVLVIGGLIFVIVLGIFRGWLIRAFVRVVEAVFHLLAPLVIAAVVVIAVAIPILFGSYFLTNDGAAMLGWSWAGGFPLLLPVNVAALVVASHLQRVPTRFLVVAVGTGWWALLPSGFEGATQASFVWLHSVLVAGVWVVLFRLSDRPRAGIPGRILSFLRIENVPRADEPTDPH